MKEENSMKKYNLSNKISILALIISILSIYFSVFYKNHDPIVSIIDSKIDFSSNTVKVDLLFYNKGIVMLLLFLNIYCSIKIMTGKIRELFS